MDNIVDSSVSSLLANPDINIEKPVDNRRENGQFGKGNNANPMGRPHKGVSITETIRRMMGKSPEVKEALGAKILDLALNGDMAAIKLLWNYVDGMPVQTTEFSNKNDKPFLIIDGPRNTTNQPVDEPPAETEPGAGNIVEPEV